MIDKLILDGPLKKNIAVGVDIRTRDFSSWLLKDIIHRLRRIENIEVGIIFLECDYTKLLNRYNETRRKHPLSGVKSLDQALKEEIQFLKPVKEFADLIIDTSEYSPNELRSDLLRNFKGSISTTFAIFMQSFSFKNGIPRNVDMVFDCRFLKNPYWEPDLREFTGERDLVEKYVKKQPEFGIFCTKVLSLLKFLIPVYKHEGKSQLSIGIGCTGGRHRSVVVTNVLANGLSDLNHMVHIDHREIIQENEDN